MTHTVNAQRYRIGKNLYWSIFTSSLYFNKALRLQIVLTSCLAEYFSLSNFNLVKLFISYENYHIKFNVIAYRCSKKFLIREMDYDHEEEQIKLLSKEIITDGLKINLETNNSDMYKAKLPNKFLSKRVSEVEITREDNNWKEFKDDLVNTADDLSGELDRARVTQLQFQGGLDFFEDYNFNNKNDLFSHKSFKKQITIWIKTGKYASILAFFKKLFFSISYALNTHKRSINGSIKKDSFFNMSQIFFNIYLNEYFYNSEEKLDDFKIEFNLFIKNFYKCRNKFIKKNNFIGGKLMDLALIESYFIKIRNPGVFAKKKKNLLKMKAYLVYISLIKLILFLQKKKLKLIKISNMSSTSLAQLKTSFLKKIWFCAIRAAAEILIPFKPLNKNKMFLKKDFLNFMAFKKKRNFWRKQAFNFRRLKTNVLKKKKLVFVEKKIVIKEKKKSVLKKKLLNKLKILKKRVGDFNQAQKEFKKAFYIRILADTKRSIRVINILKGKKRDKSKKKILLNRFKKLHKGRALSKKNLPESGDNLHAIKNGVFFLFFKKLHKGRFLRKSALRIFIKSVKMKFFCTNINLKKKLLKCLPCNSVRKFRLTTFEFLLEELSSFSFFSNWVSRTKAEYLSKKFKGKFFWISFQEFLLDFQKEMSYTFNCNIKLKLYTFRKIFSSQRGFNFIKLLKRRVKKAHVWRNDKMAARIGLLSAYLALEFKSPQLIVTFFVNSLEKIKKHYSTLSNFIRLFKNFDLKDYNLVGVRIGFFGRINGRDRKFKHFINIGYKPSLRKLCLKVDYAEEQCVSVYGIIHIHVWMYRF